MPDQLQPFAPRCRNWRLLATLYFELTEFPAKYHAAINVHVSAVDQALAAVDPDALSPREALEVLYQLKAVAARR